MDKYQTIKIWKSTLSNLRLLSGFKEMSIVKVLDSLVQNALDREIKKRHKKGGLL